MHHFLTVLRESALKFHPNVTFESSKLAIYQKKWDLTAQTIKVVVDSESEFPEGAFKGWVSCHFFNALIGGWWRMMTTWWKICDSGLDILTSLHSFCFLPVPKDRQYWKQPRNARSICNLGQIRELILQFSSSSLRNELRHSTRLLKQKVNFACDWLLPWLRRWRTVIR